MKMINDYQAKKVLVVGLGKSGVSAAKLLVKLGAQVTINDKNELTDQALYLELEKLGVTLITGGHPLSLLDDAELIVKNPGIPYSNELIQAAQARSLPIITEPELAYEVSEAPFIGVTGTNGKTTTTTLIAEMINHAPGHKAYAAGNIGVALADVAQKAQANEQIVAELSSFQLMGITKLHPKIAVLTNIYEAHTDYHGSRQNYIEAKLNLLKNQTQADFLVINFDNEEWQQLATKTKATVIPFSRLAKSEKGAYLKDGFIYYQTQKIMAASELKLPGTHNLENALAAVCVAKLLQLPTTAITTVLQNFSGVRHRTQYVTTFNGRKFYNDSKATNMQATKKALSGFADNVILLAGGLDRGFSFDELVPDLKQHVKAMVVFGQTAPLLTKAAQQAGITKLFKTQDAVSAVEVAYDLSQPEDVILLSPACASWDQWPTFEVRGDKYIEAIENLVSKNGGN